MEFGNKPERPGLPGRFRDGSSIRGRSRWAVPALPPPPSHLWETSPFNVLNATQTENASLPSSSVCVVPSNNPASNRQPKDEARKTWSCSQTAPYRQSRARAIDRRVPARNAQIRTQAHGHEVRLGAIRLTRAPHVAIQRGAPRPGGFRSMLRTRGTFANATNMRSNVRDANRAPPRSSALSRQQYGTSHGAREAPALSPLIKSRRAPSRSDQVRKNLCQSFRELNQVRTNLIKYDA